jgi:hypothetical protein
MTARVPIGVRRLAAALVVAGALAGLAACTGSQPRFLTDPMAPPGSTPEQIRVFCTQLGDEAANWNFVCDDPLARSLRWRDRIFAECMARHHITP